MDLHLARSSIWKLVVINLEHYHSEKTNPSSASEHEDIIKWKHFPCYWPFMQGIHRSPVNFPHKGQWCRALMFSLICTWTNSSVNNRWYTGDLRCHSAHYEVIVMKSKILVCPMVVTICGWLVRPSQPWVVHLSKCPPQNTDLDLTFFYHPYLHRVILGLCPANERWHYFVTMSLIDWVQA